MGDAQSILGVLNSGTMHHFILFLVLVASLRWSTAPHPVNRAMDRLPGMKNLSEIALHAGW
jgi:hypothetical protein